MNPTQTAPEVMLNEKPQRETVTRILHDFVMLKLANDDTSLGELKVLLEDSVKKIMRVFEDDLSEYRQMLLAMEGSGYDGPGGLLDLITEARARWQALESIRLVLGTAAFLPRLIAEDVVRAVAENQKLQQQHFDSRTYSRMRDALESAGYSPDEDGILALLDDAKPRPTD